MEHPESGLASCDGVSGCGKCGRGVGGKVFVLAVLVVVFLLIIIDLVGSSKEDGEEMVVSEVEGSLPALEAVAVGDGVLVEKRLSEIYKGILAYAEGFEGGFPSVGRWCDLVLEHGGVAKETLGGEGGRFGMNEAVGGWGLGLPGDLVLLFESADGWNASGGRAEVYTGGREPAGAYILYCDGRVEFVLAEDMPYIRWVVGVDF